MFVGGSSLLVVSAIACGNSDDDTSGFGGGTAPTDAGSSPDAEATPDASPDAGTACTTNDDCPSGSMCFYPIAAACSASGVCLTPPEPACDSATTGCACDGGSAVIPCYFDGANGYATAPITGMASAVLGPDGGYVDECVPFADAGS